MEKSDLKELRKAVKSTKDNIVTWVYGVYVDSENNPCWEDVRRLSDMEDAERFRHLGIFARGLSTGIGKDSFPVGLGRQNEELIALREAEGRDVAEFEEFRDRLLSEYVHTEPYYAALANVYYDVPAKSGDGRKLEDGDSVYIGLLLLICPAKLSKPALGLTENRVAELDRRWQIGSPVSGFLYPAFSDRGEDRNTVLIHSAAPEDEDCIRGMFDIPDESCPVGMKTQKAVFAALIDQMDMDLECAAAVAAGVAEKTAEEGVTVIGREDVRKIAEAAGADTETFDEIYESTVGDTEISAAAASGTYVLIKTDSALIRIPSERAQLVRTGRIGGRDYIMIPADGEVTLNGAAVTAAPEDGPLI